MPPLRPPTPSDSGSDSETDAPEAVPLTLAKRAARTREAAQEEFAKGERERRKERNRERDRRVKARRGEKADAEDGEGEEEEEDVDVGGDVVEEGGVESRMERAMREAAAEESDEEMSGGDEEMLSGEDDSADDSADAPPTNPHHLPAHLFESAFTAPPTNMNPKPKSKVATTPGKRRRARKAGAKSAKQLVVGSRTIRIDTAHARPALPATLPSRKVRAFTERVLALRPAGSKNTSRAWTRLPANIGVMRPRAHGPPAGFVRGEA
ncbi:hypothetical protein C8J57DRAFT_1717235 [Mycena rebaudengoi]|nr:hypothetical protein C8J57DRAFT_1717235 [Mycena rebaudengoi]